MGIRLCQNLDLLGGMGQAIVARVTDPTEEGIRHRTIQIKWDTTPRDLLIRKDIIIHQISTKRTTALKFNTLLTDVTLTIK